MKKISSKAKIIIFSFIIIIIILSVFIGKAIVRNNRITYELTTIAKSYGLENIKIIIGGKVSEYDFYNVTVDCTNFESLTYSQMYALDNAMSSVDDAYVSNITSNGDSYEVFPSTKSIYKNGFQIHDDYWNSQSYKDATKNDKNKSDYSNSNKKNSSSSFTTYKSSSKKDDDPYNAKDYKFAEDFYDDHYDDFFDFDDAENYFNKHND